MTSPAPPWTGNSSAGCWPRRRIVIVEIVDPAPRRAHAALRGIEARPLGAPLCAVRRLLVPAAQILASRLSSTPRSTASVATPFPKMMPKLIAFAWRRVQPSSARRGRGSPIRPRTWRSSWCRRSSPRRPEVPAGNSRHRRARGPRERGRSRGTPGRSGCSAGWVGGGVAPGHRTAGMQLTVEAPVDDMVGKPRRMWRDRAPVGARVEGLDQVLLGGSSRSATSTVGKRLAAEREPPRLPGLRPRQQRRPLLASARKLRDAPEEGVELDAGSDAGRRQRRIEGGEMRIECRHRLRLRSTHAWCAATSKPTPACPCRAPSRRRSADPHSRQQCRRRTPALGCSSARSASRRVGDDGVIERIGEL